MQRVEDKEDYIGNKGNNGLRLFVILIYCIWFHYRTLKMLPGFFILKITNLKINPNKFRVCCLSE